MSFSHLAKKSSQLALVVLALLGATLAIKQSSLAQENPISSRSAFTAALVTAYSPCKRPNAVTLATAGVPLPACTPPVRLDTQCGFGPNGNGQITARSANTDVQIEANLTGLSGCEGQQLRLVLSARGTVNFCPDGDCTTVDVADFPMGKCTVKGGACTIRNNVNAFTEANEGFHVFERGTTTRLSVLGCSVMREDMRTFDCGILVK